MCLEGTSLGISLCTTLVYMLKSMLTILYTSCKLQLRVPISDEPGGGLSLWEGGGVEGRGEAIL